MIETRMQIEPIESAALVLSALAKAEWQKATGHLYAFLELHPKGDTHLKALIESFIRDAEELI